MMGPILAGLAKTRQAIAVEQQGHGRPADVDRPFAYEQIRLEHGVALFGLRGGGVMGDLAGRPGSQLAVLPGTAHFVPPGFGSWTEPTGCWQ